MLFRSDLLRTAAAVEQLSDHPLADAVVTYATEHLNGQALADARDLESITGRGLKAAVGNLPVHVGKAASSTRATGRRSPTRSATGPRNWRPKDARR